MTLEEDKVQDNKNNPYNENSFSDKVFDILKKYNDISVEREIFSLKKIPSIQKNNINFSLESSKLPYETNTKPFEKRQNKSVKVFLHDFLNKNKDHLTTLQQKLAAFLISKLGETKISFWFLTGQLSSYKWAYMHWANTLIINLNLVNPSTIEMNPTNKAGETKTKNITDFFETILHELCHAIEGPWFPIETMKWPKEWEISKQNLKRTPEEVSFENTMNKLFIKSCESLKEPKQLLDQWNGSMDLLKKKYWPMYMGYYPLTNVNEHIVWCLINIFYQAEVVKIEIIDQDPFFVQKKQRVFDTFGIDTGFKNNVLLQTLTAFGKYATKWETYKQLGATDTNSLLWQYYWQDIKSENDNLTFSIWSSIDLNIWWKAYSGIISWFPDPISGKRVVYVRYQDGIWTRRWTSFSKDDIQKWNPNLK